MIELGMYLPTPLLEELQPELDIAFLEPCTDVDYVKYYSNFPGWKILDNGYIENNNHPWVLERLLEYAELVAADVVIAPDRLGDWVFNLVNAKECARRIGKDKTSVVLAGRTPSAFVNQLDEVFDEGPFAAACTPYTLNRGAFNGPLPKRMHLLGLRIPEDYSAYTTWSKRGIHISLDTVEPISAAYHGWDYTNQGFATFPRAPMYKELIAEKVSVALVKKNISWLKTLLHEERSLWR